jgi:dihydrodipicolinate synthase/N-acetylneuraminate lyase
VTVNVKLPWIAPATVAGASGAVSAYVTEAPVVNVALVEAVG